MALTFALGFGFLALLDAARGILRGSRADIVCAVACALASVGSACAGLVTP